MSILGGDGGSDVNCVYIGGGEVGSDVNCVYIGWGWGFRGEWCLYWVGMGVQM